MRRSNYFYTSPKIFRIMNEMVGVFSTYMREEGRIQGFGGEN
jgi:hypothetical protein